MPVSLAAELVARADDAYVALESSSHVEKRLREAVRSLFRGVTPESAAAFVNAVAAARVADDSLAAADAAARAYLAASGVVPDARATQHEEAIVREMRHDPAPAGTILRAVAPAWRNAKGELVTPGAVVVSLGPSPALLRPLERAERCARRIARRAEDVAARFTELRADLAGLDDAARTSRAIEALRYVEALAAIHHAPGVDMGEAGLADLVAFLEERGVRREPREGERIDPQHLPEENSSTTETALLRVTWQEDAAPQGTVLRRVRSALVRAGQLLGEKGEVLASLGRASDPGPRSALPGLLKAALARPLAGPLRSLVEAARARAAGLSLEAAETGGLEVALDLAVAVSGADEGAARLRGELDAYLVARGLVPYPEDGARARAELERAPAAYEVELVAAERPRGEVVAIHARGYRDAAGAVLRRARVACSRGPGDPLAAALTALAAALGNSKVPELSPLARLAAIAAAVEAPAASEKDPLVEAAQAARAAEVLAATAEASVARAIESTLAQKLFPALAACGVEPLPAPGAEALAPSAADLVDADYADSPRAAGSILEVKRRGFVRGGAALARAQLVLSRGPRPRLLDVCEALAATSTGPLAALADPAAELARKIQAFRAEVALGKSREPRVREVAFEAGLAFLRLVERAGPGAEVDAFLGKELRSALALLHDQVEVFPLDREGLDGNELAQDPSYEVESAWDDAAPAGAVLRLLRAGVRDRRGGVARLERAKVVVSLGRRPAVEDALEQLLGIARDDPRSPPGLDERARAVRDAGRGLVKERGSPLEARLREALAHAAAALLDAVEPRALLDDAKGRALAERLDGSVLPGLAQLGVLPFPRAGEAAERTSARLEVSREFSDTVAPGEILRRARRGLEVDGKVVRAGKVVVSLGPRDELLVLLEELGRLAPSLPPAARGPIEALLARERTIEEDVRAGKTLPPPTARSLALLDGVNGALEKLADADRMHLLGRVAPSLTAATRTGGLAVFPEASGPGFAPLADELLRDAAAVELEAPLEFLGGLRGEVVSVARFGARRGGSVVRPARVRLDLGPRPAFLADLEAAGRAGANVAPLVEALHDPRRAGGDDALALAVHDLHRAHEAARGPLERALRGLGADVFPRAGELLPADLPGDAVARRPVYAEGQLPGTVVRIDESGLRRGARVLRPARAEVSRGPMSQALKALSEAAASELPSEVKKALEPLVARLEQLPEDKQSDEDGDRVIVEALAVLDPRSEERAVAERERLVAHLRGRGYVVVPDGASGSIDALRAVLGGDAAIETPRRRFGAAQAGEILAVERRAVVRGDLVLAKARVVVCAGTPNELHALVQDVRDKLAAEADAKSLAEIDEVLERAADAKPDRMHFLVFPVMNVLHRMGAKEKHGGGLKTYLRGKGVREITAYSGYPAAELGPKKLEEIRVSSEREKGKIVKVLRPGFEEEKGGAILQKVQAEVSR